MTKRTLDFDKYREEKGEDTIEIVAWGKTWEIPATPTLAVVEDMLELNKKNEAEEDIPDDKILGMLRELLGDEPVDYFRDQGATIGEMESLFERVFDMYKGELQPGEDEEGDEEGGSGKGSTSSSTGEQ